MLRVNVTRENSQAHRILCLGAHCDDIEIGCGGTILRLLEENKNCEICWIVFSSDPRREEEALKSAKLFLRGAKAKKIVIRSYRDSFLPFFGRQIKEEFEHLRRDFSPQLILTHYRNDLHQDHRLISDLTWNTFRDHLILEYEIPKYDGDMGSPNFFIHLDKPICRRKMKYILDTFRTQQKKPWFTEDTFRAILRLRGIESNAPNKYAEAFYCRKIIF